MATGWLNARGWRAVLEREVAKQSQFHRGDAEKNNTRRRGWRNQGSCGDWGYALLGGLLGAAGSSLPPQLQRFVATKKNTTLLTI